MPFETMVWGVTKGKIGLRGLKFAKASPQRTLTKIPCPGPLCDRWFKPYSKNGRRRKFCSYGCFADARLHPLIPCPVCDAMFLPRYVKDGRWTRHCSAQCGRASTRGTRYLGEQWSREYDACTHADCHTPESPHHSGGYCSTCYWRERNCRRRDSQRRSA